MTRREFVAGASVSACLSNAQPRENSSLRLWFKQPAATWTDALPIGNGRLGAMLFGGVKDERLQLNDDTLWSVAPRQWNNPDALKHLAEVRKLVLDQQDYVAADAVCRQMQGPFAEAYQPLADLHLTMDHDTAATAYRRELDLATAVARTSYRIGATEYIREVFASQPAQAIVARLTTSAAGGMSVTLAIDSPVQSSSQAAEGGGLRLTGKAPAHIEHTPARPEDAVVYDPAEGKGKGMRFEASVRVIVESGTVRPDAARLRVEGARAVTILIVSATGYRGYTRDPDGSAAEIATACRVHLDGLRGRSYKALRAAHIADYRKLFDRVSLDLPKLGARTERPPNASPPGVAP